MSCSVDRTSTRCSGGYSVGTSDYFFCCPTLVSCWIIHLSQLFNLHKMYVVPCLSKFGYKKMDFTGLVFDLLTVFSQNEGCFSRSYCYGKLLRHENDNDFTNDWAVFWYRVCSINWFSLGNCQINHQALKTKLKNNLHEVLLIPWQLGVVEQGLHWERLS